MGDPQDMDNGMCDFCAQEMDTNDATSPCVRLHCPQCGQRLYHRDCVSVFLRRMKWKSETSAKAGLGAFPCPRGKGKTPLDESMQCKCRITIVTTVVARGSKAEQKKAARVAAMSQIQEQLKQQQAQKRATKPQQQQQQRQQQQQQWQPCPSAVAAVPQVSEALRARLAGPEQHEVPGMEFVSNKKPKAKKKGAAGGAGARAEAAQGVQAAGAARSSASTHTTAAAHVGGGGSRAELNSNNWVSSVDAYNKLLAQLGAGSSDEDEDNNAQGQQAPQPPPLTSENSGGGASFGVPLVVEEVEDEEEDGTLDVLQSVLGVLAAFGVEVPLGSHTSPEWLRTVLVALDKLAEQGYDVDGFRDIVQEQLLLCSAGGGDASGSSNQSSAGGGWDGHGLNTAAIEDQHSYPPEQYAQQQQWDLQPVFNTATTETAQVAAMPMAATTGALPSPILTQQQEQQPALSPSPAPAPTQLAMHQAIAFHIPSASLPPLQPLSGPAPFAPVPHGVVAGLAFSQAGYDPLRFGLAVPGATIATAPAAIALAAVSPLQHDACPAANVAHPTTAAPMPLATAAAQVPVSAPAGVGAAWPTALPINWQQQQQLAVKGPGAALEAAAGGAAGGQDAAQQQEQQEDEDEDLAELLSLCLPAQA